jgi:hypothetical protein
MVMDIKFIAPKPPRAPELPEGLASDFSMINEKYPKIGEKIMQMWKSAALQRYLNNLILDERGDRQGFPMPVVSALLRIHEFHAKLVPDAGDKDSWGEAL